MDKLQIGMFRGKDMHADRTCIGYFSNIFGGYFIDTYEVITESLAMFTGLYDKNGVPIFGSFEVDGKMSKGGDIINVKMYSNIRDEFYYQNCKVPFSKGVFYLKVIGNNLICYQSILLYAGIDCAPDADYCKNLEVIGNCFQNPELLEA
jgi:hypothetical protein